MPRQTSRQAPKGWDPSLAVPDWYRPPDKIREFHASRARVRALIGGRGSGKTTAVAVEVVAHAWHNAGAKVYVLRKTQESNKDTTLETFEQIFARLGPLYVDTGESLFRKMEGGRIFRLPSRKAVEAYEEFLRLAGPTVTKRAKEQWLESVGARLCSWLYFAGVPEERYRGSRFRGFECSLLVFVEADQLDREDLDLGMACLRWKGADPSTCDEKGYIRDSGVILDTNPPSPDHWIAQLEEETKQDPNFAFWHLRTRDNAHNLPDGYIEALEQQYRRNPAMWARMLEGQYAHAFTGAPVLYAFDCVLHARPSLSWPGRDAYLIRGWDFGSTHAVIWSAYFIDADGVEHWWDLLEYFAEKSDVDRQCQAVLELTRKHFPFWNDREKCAGVRDYCDAAGAAWTDKGSSVEVLRSYGIFPVYRRMGLQESLAVYNRLLTMRDKKGEPVYLISKQGCPRLYLASAGGYHYPAVGEAGYSTGEPVKGPAGGNYDHLVDAARYAKCNCLRLARDYSQLPAPPRGPLTYKRVLNPVRRGW